MISPHHQHHQAPPPQQLDRYSEDPSAAAVQRILLKLRLNELNDTTTASSSSSTNKDSSLMLMFDKKKPLRLEDDQADELAKWLCLGRAPGLEHLYLDLAKLTRTPTRLLSFLSRAESLTEFGLTRTTLVQSSLSSSPSSTIAPTTTSGLDKIEPSSASSLKNHHTNQVEIGNALIKTLARNKNVRKVSLPLGCVSETILATHLLRTDSSLEELSLDMIGIQDAGLYTGKGFGKDLPTSLRKLTLNSCGVLNSCGTQVGDTIVASILEKLGAPATSDEQQPRSLDTLELVLVGPKTCKALKDWVGSTTATASCQKGGNRRRHPRALLIDQCGSIRHENDWEMLLEGLASNHTMTHLQFGNARLLNGARIQSLLQRNRRLESLELLHKDYDSAELALIAEGIEATTAPLQHLKIGIRYERHADKSGFQRFVHSVAHKKNGSLVSLELTATSRLDNSWTQELAVLIGSGLRRLKLNHVSRDGGLRSLVQELENNPSPSPSTLTHLDLSDNVLRDEGCHALTALLSRLNKLRRLSMHYPRYSSASTFQDLIAAFENNKSLIGVNVASASPVSGFFKSKIHPVIVRNKCRVLLSLVDDDEDNDEHKHHQEQQQQGPGSSSGATITRASTTSRAVSMGYSLWPLLMQGDKNVTFFALQSRGNEILSC